MVKHSGKLLVIEGTEQDENGSLGAAFHSLLTQKLSRPHLPHIVMGNSTGEAMNIYKSEVNKRAHALIDLDGKGADVEAANFASMKAERKKYYGVEQRTTVYFMVQEMEAWFLSQPEILKAHYKKDVSGRMVQKHPSQFSDPVAELRRVVSQTKKKSYHKVVDGSRLLLLLNLDQLMSKFEDVKQLVEDLTK